MEHASHIRVLPLSKTDNRPLQRLYVLAWMQSPLRYVLVKPLCAASLFTCMILADPTVRLTVAPVPCPLLARQVLRQARKCLVDVEDEGSERVGGGGGAGSGGGSGAEAVLARRRKVDMAHVSRGSRLRFRGYSKRVAVVVTRLGSCSVCLTRVKVNRHCSRLRVWERHGGGRMASPPTVGRQSVL